MSASDQLLPGFRDPVGDAQRVFRAMLNALSRPGSVHVLRDLPEAPAPFNSVAAALILALADHETRVWLDDAFAADGRAVGHVRFHTGATIVRDPSASTFAVVSAAGRMPPASRLATGTLEYPDRSTTLILQVEHLAEGSGFTLRGPGIETTSRLLAGPLPAGFLADMVANRALFPCGFDVVLASSTALAGLPRTTIIEE
jgi:alpha-D-ribose 1-methylphosphonate 5-triphosphate synthase subunit PhnH